jgi:hypothetical protein
VTPRLLTEEAAREYLAGIDPRKICEPLRVGRRLTWDRVAIDRALDALTNYQPDPAPAGPLAAWERANGHKPSRPVLDEQGPQGR